MEDPLKRNKPTSYCVGCGYQILDRFILRVFPDLDWHAECLKCAECHQYLDESCTCFIRDGKTFCKDHSRFCTIKCAKCHNVLTRNMYVMRTRMNVYHSQCFRCESCSRQLLPGDEYVLRDGQLLCTDHHKHSNRLMGTSNNPHHKCQDTVGMSDDIKSASQLSPPWSSMQRRSERAVRVRTVLSESQLRMLQTCYSANPRPDALMKEQLVEMTGLSPRVIRVWFQNKRCQDKKRCIMMRHTQKQLEGCLDISEEPLLIASAKSQDSDMFVSPPWKLLTCFIEHKGADLQ
ncbi:insulin gene enhancer protein ISL-1-like [Myxocyprinus asiaticus]|uniref:insulin gene enhancer protein ISL-1-like n=1 Tax=Myxocyprinus asiaticus TaxID=70543 RepID=UPI0022225697|nr:insulin gene enhancer protein ISL-1-like [Myxocyprinus asiaticus]